MKHVVLIDIDGVLALEIEPPLSSDLELIRLHDQISARVAALGAPAVILTHRSRREAAHILQSIGLDRSVLAGLIAAEDLLVASVRALRFGDLFKGGLLKSFILPEIERRFGAPRGRIAFIDDKMSNLRDLQGQGLGLAVHAPSSVDLEAGEVVSFDFAAFQAAIEGWRLGGDAQALVALPPRSAPILPWQRTGASTRRHGDHAFNHARRLGQAARLGLSRSRAPK